MQPPYLYTEAEYEQLVLYALANWRPVFYPNALEEGETILWRHDVDYSPQRALALAEIEYRHGLKATYFFQFRSFFYNLLEPGMDGILRRIQAYGHSIGLHFDPTLYEDRISPQKDMAHFLGVEKRLLEECFELSIEAFSLHNPTLIDPVFDQRIHEMAGLVNAGSHKIAECYVYVSDSRGGWRRDDGPRLLLERSELKLHILTHPWRWTPKPESVEGMMLRHVEGLAKKKRRQALEIAASWAGSIAAPQGDL